MDADLVVGADGFQSRTRKYCLWVRGGGLPPGTPCTGPPQRLPPVPLPASSAPCLAAGCHAGIAHQRVEVEGSSSAHAGNGSSTWGAEGAAPGGSWQFMVGNVR